MKLNWEKQKSGNINTIHHAECSDSSDTLIGSAIEQCVNKTMDFLPSNVIDDSRYLMFEWDTLNSTLSIAVTDQSKENDSPDVVKCVMSGLALEMQKIRENSPNDWEEKSNEHASEIKYCINNCITTASEFLRYSLIAAFHTGSRNKSILV